jgi:MFS family permease
MARSADSAVPVGYRKLLRQHPNYRLLLTGGIISQLGDWFNLIATASLIAMLTGSGLAIGGLFAVRMLAPFLTSPISGVLADRYDRKRILVACDLSRVLVVACFLLVRSPEHVWLLYVLTAVQLAIGGAHFTARRAILPDVVPPEVIGAANALSSATWSIMLAIGAAAGGLVAGAWGVYTAFAIDACTFLVSAAIVSRIESNRVERDVLEGGGFFTEYTNGLRYLRKTPDIAIIALQKAFIGLIVSAGFEVVQVRLAIDVFGGGASLGLMYACSGIGSGLGPIAGRRFTGDRDRALRKAMSLGYLIAAAGLLMISSMHSLWLVLAATVLRSSGGSLVWVYSTQLLLTNVPEHVRGRVFSVELAAFNLGAAIAAGVIGWLLDSSPDLGHLIQWMALVSIVPAIIWTLWNLKRHRVPE